MTVKTLYELTQEAVQIKNNIFNTLTQAGVDMEGTIFADVPQKIQEAVNKASVDKVFVSVTEPADDDEVSVPLDISWEITGVREGSSVFSIVVLNGNIIYSGIGNTYTLEDATRLASTNTLYVVCVQDNRCGVSNSVVFSYTEPSENGGGESGQGE